VFVVDTLTSASLRCHGFDFHGTSLRQSLTVFPFRPLSLSTRHRSPAKTLTYWHRPHTSKTRLPVLFIHGIGIGLYPYVNFLVELDAEDGEDGPDGQIGIIAVEIMPVSFRITSEALLKDRMCEEIHDILEAHGWDKVVLVSHS
jgi:pimeloyl-ACP methyl ester carboxylesterase